MKNILTYRNTGECTMIEYKICTDDNDEVVKIEFTFSKLFLYGEAGTIGDTTIFPEKPNPHYIGMMKIIRCF